MDLKYTKKYCGAHNAPPDLLVGWGRHTPSPSPTPLVAFGASILAYTTLDTRAFGVRNSAPSAPPFVSLNVTSWLRACLDLQHVTSLLYIYWEYCSFTVGLKDIDEIKPFHGKRSVLCGHQRHHFYKWMIPWSFHHLQFMAQSFSPFQIVKMLGKDTRSLMRSANMNIPSPTPIFTLFHRRTHSA